SMKKNSRAKSSSKKNPTSSRKRQLDLPPNKVPRFFGSSLSKSHPKTVRPLSTKQALHLVLKSDRAVGTSSMLARPHSRQVHKIVHRQAAKFCVRIYHFVNVGNHLHFVIRI